jgi:hypothetical protein
MFAKKKVTLPPGRHKLVLLDEADNMTTAAQQALRRIMEIYSDSTRFALACNISSKIIEPIQSRCAILRFGRLSDEEVLKRLREVLAKEMVPFNDKGLEALIFTADGDMRQVAPANVSPIFANFFSFFFQGSEQCAIDGGGVWVHIGRRCVQGVRPAASRGSAADTRALLQGSQLCRPGLTCLFFFFFFFFLNLIAGSDGDDCGAGIFANRHCHHFFSGGQIARVVWRGHAARLYQGHFFYFSSSFQLIRTSSAIRLQLLFCLSVF